MTREDNVIVFCSHQVNRVSMSRVKTNERLKDEKDGSRRRQFNHSLVQGAKPPRRKKKGR